jgi:hypothetical protein
MSWHLDHLLIASLDEHLLLGAPKQMTVMDTDSWNTQS